MKRFWVGITIISVLFVTPILLSQETTTTGETKTTGGTTAPGVEPTSKEEKKTTETDDKKTGKAVLWTDKNGVKYANSWVQFSLVATDELSKVDFIEYKIDKSAFLKYTGAFSIQEEGPHTIVYRSVDKAGNREIDQLFNIIIDNKAPSIKVFPAQPFFKKGDKNYAAPGNSFTLHVTDDYSGVKTIEYGVNSKELKSYSGDTIKFSGTGTQFVQFQATDNLGNATGAQNLVVEIDAGKPVVEVNPTVPLINVGSTQYARRKTQFVVKGSDSGSGVVRLLVRIDGASEWQTYTEPLSFDKEKEHKIEAKAIDAVGNESDVKTITFVVDDNPPRTTIKPVIEK